MVAKTRQATTATTATRGLPAFDPRWVCPVDIYTSTPPIRPIIAASIPEREPVAKIGGINTIAMAVAASCRMFGPSPRVLCELAAKTASGANREKHTAGQFGAPWLRFAENLIFWWLYECLLRRSYLGSKPQDARAMERHTTTPR